MRTPQLVCAVVVALIPAVACNRADTRANARAAAAEVQDVAGRAGEKLADSWLATKIQAQYFADDDVKARNILVTARDGVVTLKGRVDNQSAHEQALQIARNTDGVTSVSDQLTQGGGLPARAENRTAEQQTPGPVATTGTAAGAIAERLNDRGITASIQSRYFLDSNIKGRRIDVTTQQGVVTLRGDVASDNERAQALILARTTEGVERVEDALTVTIALAQAVEAASAPAEPAAPVQTQDETLAMQIESKLGADTLLKSAPVEVTAKDGVVLLEGTVPTAAAKQRALATARATEGVLQVVDRLKVGRTSPKASSR